MGWPVARLPVQDEKLGEWSQAVTEPVQRVQRVAGAIGHTLQVGCRKGQGV